MVRFGGNLGEDLVGDLGEFTRSGGGREGVNIEHRTPNIEHRREEEEELGTANLENLANLLERGGRRKVNIEH